MTKKGNPVASADRTSGKGGPQRAASDNGHYFRILNSIRQIIRAIDVDSRRLASGHKVTGPQLMCLMAVLEKGTIKALDIAEKVHFSPSTLVGVLDRLEAKGLIRRERNAEDRRKVSIAATEAGKRLVSRTPLPLQHSLGHALGRLSTREREELAGWMERLVDLLGTGGLSDDSMLGIGPRRRRQR